MDKLLKPEFRSFSKKQIEASDFDIAPNVSISVRPCSDWYNIFETQAGLPIQLHIASTASEQPSIILEFEETYNPVHAPDNIGISLYRLLNPALTPDFCECMSTYLTREGKLEIEYNFGSEDVTIVYQIGTNTAHIRTSCETLSPYIVLKQEIYE